MTKPVLPAALLLALSALFLPAHAQGIYRCGASYSDAPCPGATMVATDAAPSAAQRAQADAATRRDARLAEALEKDRLRLEARAPTAIILATAPIGGRPVQAGADKPAAKSKLKKPEQFSAVSPKKPVAATTKKKKSETA